MRTIRWIVGLSLFVFLLSPGHSLARPPASLEPRVVVAHHARQDSLLLQRESSRGDWNALAANGEVYSRDLLAALPGTRAALETSTGARLTLLGNLPHLSSFPVLDSAVILHDSRAYDLDFTLDRGRVVVSNRKEKGSLRVWVRLPGDTWELVLGEAAAVGFERYGRWPRGISFTRSPGPDDRPRSEVILLVLKGSVELKAGGQQYLLSAPPGPAYYHWDSVAGHDAGPQKRETVPNWADAKFLDSADAKAVADAAKVLAAQLQKKSVDVALVELLEGARAEPKQALASLRRQLAVYGFAALDDLPRLADALTDEEHAEVRDTAVAALRHWIGQGAGNDQQLFEVLTRAKRYSPAQAETLLELLHSPFDAEQPETYETLIAYLRHERTAIRELARWHLYRLVPAGKKIPYDAGASEAERARGVEEWRKLIPKGKLPPKP
jgi:hypothetical protein